MDPLLCRTLNKMSLEQLARYLSVNVHNVCELYDELLDDSQFLAELNEQIRNSRLVYKKGVFRHDHLDSVDWLALQRITLYILVRLFKPDVCLETGVFYGGTTCFILNGLRRNAHGQLISIDLRRDVPVESSKHHLVRDTEDLPDGLDTGFLVHEALKERWSFIRGSSHEEIPKLAQTVDLYCHDSDHAFDFLTKEMNLVWPKMSPSGIVMVDDLNWSNGFFRVCADQRAYPLILTDNGKSGILARTGIIKLDHPFNTNPDVVGTLK